jgi:hypothetical protein
MSNTYPLHQTIHELLPQLNQKYGLELEVDNNFRYYEFFGRENQKQSTPEPRIYYLGEVQKIGKNSFELSFAKSAIIGSLLCPAIQAPQIRQILFGLKELLGGNFEYVHNLYHIREYDEWSEKSDSEFYSMDEISMIAGKNQLIGMNSQLAKSQAQALDDRWLRPTEKDGKYTGQSLFDTNPDQVLEELIEILKELLK